MFKNTTDIYGQSDLEFGLLPVLQNKFRDVISGIIYKKKANAEGAVIILPQIENKSGLLLELFTNFLPGSPVSAHLFPEHKGTHWLQASTYESSKVLSFKTQQAMIAERAETQIRELEELIVLERTAYKHMYGILTESADTLVEHVITALKMIGFASVVNVDLLETGQSMKQEDIQVLDREIKLLIEVKGLNGQPRESNTIQVTKFLLRRTKEWQATGALTSPPHGITLVNHQKSMPPLDRDNKNVFTQAQIDDAEGFGTGLMTTWDLFRLLNGMNNFAWDPKFVQDVFYEKGRIGKHPSHYRQIGKVYKYYKNLGVVSILVDDDCTLSNDDIVGYILPNKFFEEKVENLQVERQIVVRVDPGQRGGFKSKLGETDLREGLFVYKVRSNKFS